MLVLPLYAMFSVANCINHFKVWTVLSGKFLDHIWEENCNILSVILIWMLATVDVRVQR